jgi:hypothetical protein
MIRVALQPEPIHFNDRVRQRGLRFLARTPHPTQKQWGSHNYWTEVGTELYSSYNGICAYSCHWIAPDTGWKTTEHFLPKSRHPALAYEWSNYRLVAGVLNGRKSDHDVLDPFVIEKDWFIMKFPALLVAPNSILNVDLRNQIRNTIDILGLNDEDTCMKSRSKYIENYCKGDISYQYLKQEAPFLAHELERQGLVERIKAMMFYM